MEKIIATTSWDEYGEDKEEYDWELFEHREYHKKIENENNK